MTFQQCLKVTELPKTHTHEIYLQHKSCFSTRQTSKYKGQFSVNPSNLDRPGSKVLLTPGQYLCVANQPVQTQSPAVSPQEKAFPVQPGL